MKEVGGKSLRKGKTLQFIKLDFATILENYMFIFTFPRNYLFLFAIEEVGQKFLIKNFNHMFNKMNYKKLISLLITILVHLKFWQVIAQSLSEEEIKGLKATFMNIDTDKSGSITYEELKSGLARLGSKLSETEVKQLMEAVSITLLCRESYVGLHFLSTLLVLNYLHLNTG